MNAPTDLARTYGQRWTSTEVVQQRVPGPATPLVAAEGRPMRTPRRSRPPSLVGSHSTCPDEARLDLDKVNYADGIKLEVLHVPSEAGA